MRAALVKDGVVENTIEVDPESDYTNDEFDVIDLEGQEKPVSSGWLYNGSTFTPPDPTSIPPQEETAEQKRIAALEAAVDQLILDQLMGG